MLVAFERFRGCKLTGTDGEIGEIREFYFDDRSWAVRYLVVDTGSWLLDHRVLVVPSALDTIYPEGGTASVHLSREQVRHGPPAESARLVSREREAELHRYYGWNPYWLMPATAAWGTVVPAMTLGQQPAIAQPLPDRGNAPSTHLRSSDEVVGYKVHTADGDAGRVHDFLIEEVRWQVRYVVVQSGGWFSHKEFLLATAWIEAISADASELRTKVRRGMIDSAPEFEEGRPFTREQEQALHAHYEQKPYWEVKAS